MAPLFGGRDDAESDAAEIESDIERLAAPSLPQLAAAVMSAGFGPDGPERVAAGGGL